MIEALQRRRCSALVVAHRLSTVRGADSILVMERGRVVEEGDHATLWEADGALAGCCAMKSDRIATAPMTLAESEQRMSDPPEIWRVAEGHLLVYVALSDGFGLAGPPRYVATCRVGQLVFGQSAADAATGLSAAIMVAAGKRASLKPVRDAAGTGAGGMGAHPLPPPRRTRGRRARPRPPSSATSSPPCPAAPSGRAEHRPGHGPHGQGRGRPRRLRPRRLDARRRPGGGQRRGLVRRRPGRRRGAARAGRGRSRPGGGGAKTTRLWLAATFEPC